MQVWVFGVPPDPGWQPPTPPWKAHTHTHPKPMGDANFPHPQSLDTSEVCYCAQALDMPNIVPSWTF